MRVGAVKYGLEVREGLVESGEFCRGLVEEDLGPGLVLGNEVLLDLQSALSQVSLVEQSLS